MVHVRGPRIFWSVPVRFTLFTAQLIILLLGATITEEPQSPPTSKPTQDSGLSSPNVLNLLTRISQNLESFKTESVQNWNTLEETITRQNQILAERNKIEEQRLQLEKQRFQFELERAKLTSQSASSITDQPMTEHMSS